MQTSKNLSRVITWLVAVIIGLFVFGIPVGFYVVSVNYMEGNLETEAEINSRIISQIISSNPDMWEFEQVRLQEYLSRRPRRGTPETRRVFDEEGSLVAESVNRLDAPLIKSSRELRDSGVTVGRIEIERSLRPLLLRSGLLALLLMPLGAGVFFLLHSLPLRALRRAEESLLATNDFLTRVLESTTDAILVVSGEGKIIHANTKASTMSGYSTGELMGMPVQTLFSHGDASSVGSRIATIFSGGEDSLSCEASLRTKDGRLRDVSCGAAPLFQTGKISGVIVSSEDITDRKRLTEELLKARKIESTAVLARGIAHDFNNLLTAILGNISIAKMHVAPGEKLFHLLDTAEKISVRAGSLTKKLITFSRAGKLIKRPVDIGELLRNSAGFALTNDTIRCEFRVPPGISPVELDEGQIIQVLHHIVANAGEAMPDGGTVSIEAENVSVGPGKDLPLKEGKYVRMSVSDHGAGIPEEALSSIFDPYYSTKELGSRKGMGLGLAICFSIVKNHDGLLTAESKVGKGTTFHIYLPATFCECPDIRT